MPGQLWTFSGLDGAGKTTQIELLSDALRQRGQAVCRVWIRGGYTPVFSLLKNAIRAIRPGAIPPPGRSSSRSRAFESTRMRRLWLTLSILDLYLYLVVWVRVLRLRGYNVIADRWLEDTELDFAMNFPEQAVSQWPLWRWLHRLSPTPAARLVFVIPVEESLRRSKLKAEPFPDDAETLRRRLHAYEILAQRPDVSLLSSMDSVHQVHVAVRRLCNVS